MKKYERLKELIRHELEHLHADTCEDGSGDDEKFDFLFTVEIVSKEMRHDLENKDR